MATITSQAPPIQPGSPELDELLERIAAGAETRERELAPPFEAIGWIKEAGLGRLRIPVEEGGGGASVRDGRIAGAVIPIDREGVTIEDDWDDFGQRLTGTGTTRLENVRVAEDEYFDLGEPDGEQPPSYHGVFLQLYLHGVTAGVDPHTPSANNGQRPGTPLSS